jgi:FkbM family methyltransferase
MKLRAHSPWWRKAARSLGRRLLRVAENNDDPRSGHNGEQWLLRQLLAAHAARADQGGRSFVVFDGGANTGAYTRTVLRAAQEAGCGVDVHAFEPSPRNVDQLRLEFGSKVKVVGAALSDGEGTAVLFAGGSGSSQASLVARPAVLAPGADAIDVPLLRLADYLSAHALPRVDLLKLDVEGSELAALRGLGDFLRPDAVDVIQFEYGGTTAAAGVTLEEIFALLEARGFVVAKLFPRALEVRRFRPWMEHYAYANYVAVAPRWRTA